MTNKRFKKKDTDKKQIKKEEKIANIAKGVLGAAAGAGALVLSIITLGKFGGNKS